MSAWLLSLVYHKKLCFRRVWVSPVCLSSHRHQLQMYLKSPLVQHAVCGNYLDRSAKWIVNEIINDSIRKQPYCSLQTLTLTIIISYQCKHIKLIKRVHLLHIENCLIFIYLRTTPERYGVIAMRETFISWLFTAMKWTKIYLQGEWYTASVIAAKFNALIYLTVLFSGSLRNNQQFPEPIWNFLELKM